MLGRLRGVPFLEYSGREADLSEEPTDALPFAAFVAGRRCRYIDCISIHSPVAQTARTRPARAVPIPFEAMIPIARDGVRLRYSMIFTTAKERVD